MTKKKSYDEVSVVKALNRKASINIKTEATSDGVHGVIHVLKNANDLGNSSWGKIDYLVKVHNYKMYIVDNIAKRQTINSSDDNNDIINKKMVKRQAKLNMANMSKQAMRKERK